MQQAPQPANLLMQNKTLNKHIQSYCQMLFPILILGNVQFLGALLAYVRQLELNPKMIYIYIFTSRGKT